jgi:hypothetical protein
MRNRLRLVLTISSILAIFGAAFLYARHAQRIREAELKEDLRTIRSAIANYTEYEEEAPQSLEDLVRLHYLYKIPTDPVCPRLDWKMHFGERNLILGLELKRVRGLVNVFSNCPKISSNGKAYDTW